MLKPFFFIAIGLLLLSCSAKTVLLTEKSPQIIRPKTVSLTEKQKEQWSHADLLKDTIPGMSINKAYKELIGDKRGERVIVAVMDEGIDLTHEDLKNNLWINTDEVPGNNQDDDRNGYVDDVHGYNFLGESYPEQWEGTRMIRLGLGSVQQRRIIKAQIQKERAKGQRQKRRHEQMLHRAIHADSVVRARLNKTNYTKTEVASLEVPRRVKKTITRLLKYGDSVPEVIGLLSEIVTSYQNELTHKLNVSFNGRSAVGDDPYDINDTSYGNGNPQNRSAYESHGTHVAGIIAAERDNGVGVNGIAHNVAIMSIRVVPNGDEYDKDVALGIRYAVDNGAKIINMSFGKSFSPNVVWVHDAIRYAASHDVLIVHAAGNEGLNLDDVDNPNFPNDQLGFGREISDNYLTVGASTPYLGNDLVADYSNYGATSVDIFAPGEDIYSTMPDDSYAFQGGASMAAPAVAGIAALVRSCYPLLTAPQVKSIIMSSGVPIQTNKLLGPLHISKNNWAKISKSGRLANAYHALTLAKKVATGNAADNP